MTLDIITETGVEVPVYATEGSSGFDLKGIKVLKLFKGSVEINLEDKLKNSIEKGYLYLRGGERVLLGTGIKMTIPNGYELQIRSRSGVSLKKGLIVANSPGTVDSDYVGEIGIILMNTTPYLAKIELGEALAQGVICPVEQVSFKQVTTMPFTLRGEGGFGSTSN